MRADAAGVLDVGVFGKGCAQSGKLASQSIQTFAPDLNGLWQKHAGQRGFLSGVVQPHPSQEWHFCPAHLSHQPTFRSLPHHSQNSSRSRHAGSG